MPGGAKQLVCKMQPRGRRGSASAPKLTPRRLQSYLDASGTSEMRGTVRLSGSFKLAEIADGSEHFVTFPGRHPVGREHPRRNA